MCSVCVFFTSLRGCSQVKKTISAPIAVQLTLRASPCIIKLRDAVKCTLTDWGTVGKRGGGRRGRETVKLGGPSVWRDARV